MTSFTHIDSPQALEYAIHYWRNFTFDASYMKLQDAVDGIKNKQPIAEARMESWKRWTMCLSENKLGNQDVVFHTAAVWAWNSDLETGNFVPVGETAQSNIPENRLQVHANNMCQISYAIDTFADKSVYDAQKVFEDHANSQPNFNKGNKPRRKWQEGVGSFDATYIFVAPIFTTRSAAKEALINYKLHPWIANATPPGGQFCANPDRPPIFELVDGALQDISQCSPPALQYGDLVWISFIVEFIVGSRAWNTNFVPVEIIRVGTVSRSLVGGNKSDADEHGEPAAPVLRQRLQPGQTFALNHDFPMFDPPSALSAQATGLPQQAHVTVPATLRSGSPNCAATFAPPSSTIAASTHMPADSASTRAVPATNATTSLSPTPAPVYVAPSQSPVSVAATSTLRGQPAARPAAPVLSASMLAERENYPASAHPPGSVDVMNVTAVLPATCSSPAHTSESREPLSERHVRQPVDDPSTPSNICPYDLELESPPFGNALPLPDWPDSPLIQHGKPSGYSATSVDGVESSKSSQLDSRARTSSPQQRREATVPRDSPDGTMQPLPSSPVKRRRATKVRPRKKAAVAPASATAPSSAITPSSSSAPSASSALQSSRLSPLPPSPCPQSVTAPSSVPVSASEPASAVAQKVATQAPTRRVLRSRGTEKKERAF